jgi:hypothetical protein
VNPTFSVSNAVNGNVILSSDKHTASFTPASGFGGLAAFNFTVSGSDNTSFSGKVTVLVVPSGTGLEKSPLDGQAGRKQETISLDRTTQNIFLKNMYGESYEIIDASGRLLVKKNGLSVTQIQTIDISNLRNGVYLMRVFLKGRTSLFRFLRNI